MFVYSNILEKLYCFTSGKLTLTPKNRFLLTSLSERNLGKSNYFPEARQNNVTDLSFRILTKNGMLLGNGDIYTQSRPKIYITS